MFHGKSHRGTAGVSRFGRLGARELWPLWIAAGFIAFKAAYFFASRGAVGIDNHAYWLADHHGGLYKHAPATRDAYLYAPAFAQVLWPIAQLPWPVFFGLWIVAETAAFVWLLWPLGPGWGVVALLLCIFEIQQGNILGFLAVLLVVGMHRPGLWAFSLLTKITTSLGPIWFLARGEWRPLRSIAYVTLALIGVSVAFSPHDWVAWVQFLWHHRGGSGFFPLRVAAAIALTIYAARTSRPWILAPALVLASPVLQGVQYLTLLAAIPRLRNSGAPEVRRDDAPSEGEGSLRGAAPEQNSLCSKRLSETQTIRPPRSLTGGGQPTFSARNT